MAVKVVTDSTAEFPPALAKELGITVIPLNIHFGTEVHRDGVDISGDDFYRRLVDSPRFPTTSQLPVGDFLELYRELGQTTYGIVSFHISSKLSGSLNSAIQAREQYQGDCRIEIGDSEQACMGLGLVAMSAGRAAQLGANLEEVVQATHQASHISGSSACWTLWSTLKREDAWGRPRHSWGLCCASNPS
jgi:DegV family protein with EDD domain